MALRLRGFILVVCACLVLGASPTVGQVAKPGDDVPAASPAAAAYAAAKAAYERHNYPDAMRLFRNAADDGEAGGMAGVGALYALGLGVAANDNEAGRWFKKAAKAGEGDAWVADINKLMSTVDPHTAYMTEADYRELSIVTRGDFAGLGIEISQTDGRTKVVSPLDDTPAAAAGLKAGDLIVRIDDTSTEGMSLSDVVSRVRGPIGTKVRLTVQRAEQSFEVTVTRATIRVNPVKSRLEDGAIGYVRITTFTEQTQPRLIDTLNGLGRQAGGRLKGLVLDLRNDPGGLLAQAVAVAGDFLDGGVVTRIVGRGGRNVANDFSAPWRGDRLRGVPVVVLINNGSASASEIVAGALQDHGRARVLGTRSFGKGTVQTIFPLDGLGALRVTTAEYQLPSGRSIQARGVTPDEIVLPDEAGQSKDTPRSNEASLLGAASGAIEPTIDVTLIGTERDSQLRTALQRLRGG